MTWLLIAFIGAFLGYTLVQVIYLLSFYPKQPIRLGRIRWQGWIPRWIEGKLPSVLENLLISAGVGQTIQKQLMDQRTRQAADQWISDQVSEYLTHTLPVKWPMISMLFGEKTLDKIKQALSDYVLENWDKNVQSIAQKQLSDTAIRQHARNFMHRSNHENWIDLIEAAYRQRKQRMGLISMLIGSVLALLGTLIFQVLTSL